MPFARGEVAWAEDSQEDQMLIVEALSELGVDAATVRFADDGLRLIEQVERRRPRLVVLDLKMPRMGGLDTLRRLRSDPATAGLPVVVFSSSSQPHEVASCREMGALAVVQKPLDFTALTQSVDRILQLGERAALQADARAATTAGA